MALVDNRTFFGSKPVSHCYHAYAHDMSWSHHCSISLKLGHLKLVSDPQDMENKQTVYISNDLYLYIIWYHMNATIWRGFQTTTTKTTSSSSSSSSSTTLYLLHILHTITSTYTERCTTSVLGVIRPEKVLSSILTSHGKPSRYPSVYHGFFVSFTKFTMNDFGFPWLTIVNIGA